MQVPKVFVPRTLEEALEIKAHHGAAVRALAGGTDLVGGLRKGTVTATLLLDLGRIPELGEITGRDGVLHLGARVTHDAVASSDLVRASAPILARACGSVGSQQIRNLGTVGGNLCNASPAADSMPPLHVLGAVCEIASMRGRREVSVREFCNGPGRTCLAADELLEAVRVPGMAPGAVWFYEKLGARRAVAIAKVSVAFLARREGGLFRGVRIALGAVAPTVVGAPETARRLEGRGPGEETFREAARRVSAEASPITDIRSTAEYRGEMVGALLERGLRSLTE